MNRRRALIVAALVFLAVIGGVLVWRASSSAGNLIEVAGDVRADVRVVTAPAIVTPVLDVAIGIPVPAGSAATAAARKPSTGTASSQSAATPRVAGRLTTVAVAVGDHVEAGEVVAKLDTTMLDLAVEQARLAAVRARADIGVLDSGLTKIADNRSKLVSAKGKLASAKTQLTATQAQLKATRAKLVTTRAKALAGRAQLAAQIAQLEALIASGNATSTPPAPTPQQVLAGMKAKLAQLDAGIAKMGAGITQIDAGLAKIGQGFTKLSSARSKIASGQSALNSAVRQLGNAKDVLGIMADAKLLGLQSAQIARGAAVITAPVAGTVSFARTADTVAMVGAPLIRIRPDGPRLIDTYLTAGLLSTVSLGDKADVTLDSMPGQTFGGTVTQIGTSYRYPPNTFPTPLTHMTLAAKVTITLGTDDELPFGTPADVVIHTTARR